MKVEFEVPAEATLKYLYAPSMVDRGKWHEPGWLAYLTCARCPTYSGAHGVGATAQAAIDHAVRQLNDYLARNPQGAYTQSTAPGLDLSFLEGF